MGVSHLQMRFPNRSLDELCDQIAAFGEQVAPLLSRCTRLSPPGTPPGTVPPPGRLNLRSGRARLGGEDGGGGPWSIGRSGW